jgi:hypothetical protein
MAIDTPHAACVMNRTAAPESDVGEEQIPLIWELR